MTNVLDKVMYFGTQVGRHLLLRSKGCPNCSDESFGLIERKAVVTELRECDSCSLMYRFPTDEETLNRSFYQEEYEQGFTTDLPDDVTLKILLSTKFSGHEKSYQHILDLLEKFGVGVGSRIFDYGCSWGYGSWQFGEHGLDVSAFEISKTRAAFARNKLNVKVFDELEELERNASLHGGFDVFFSNHVIEHVPRPSEVVGLARKFLAKGGLFIAITPNGSMAFRKAAPRAWSQSWGKVHPNLLSDNFWAREFVEEDVFIGSLPHGLGGADEWSRGGGRVFSDSSGPELLCAARLHDD